MHIFPAVMYVRRLNACVTCQILLSLIMSYAKYYHHYYCIIHACPSMAIYLYLELSISMFFMLFVCACQTFNKEFTYLLT